jgi:hypothetical protein
MTLHVTNGDCVAEALVVGGIDGEVLPWRDVMHHGPFPAGLSLAALAGVRADYLAGERLDRTAIRDDMLARDARLEAAVREGEHIVLWFEHDVLDQLQILQILDALAGWGVDPARTSLICRNAHPGVDPFRGLGQLMPEDLVALFPERQPLAAETFRQGRIAWAVFRGPDPRPLVTLAGRGVTGLPFLGAALARHCAEFPGVRDGLSLTERRILTLVAGGKTTPGPLFRGSMDLEDVLFLGDWSFFDRVAGLCAGPDPFLTLEGGGVFQRPGLDAPPSEAFRAQVLALTDRGHRLLAGEAGPRWSRDEWLGGVRVATTDPHWCWDALLGRFVALPGVSAG